MAERVIVRIYLPLEMGAVGRIMAAVARDFPDAIVAKGEPPSEMALVADDDVTLTPARRRRLIRERRKAAG